jgi:membrane protein DedA with SNARE-associated domain
VGRFIGFPLLSKYGFLIRLSPAKLDKAQQWFEKYGKWALFFGYFLPGIRHLSAFSAGASRLRYWLFAPFAYAGGFLWAVSFVALGYFGGEQWAKITPEARAYLFEVMGAALVLAVAAYLVARIRHLGRQG